MSVKPVPADILIGVYGHAQAALRAAVFPALVVEEVTDDGETFMALRCPRCDGIVSDAGLVAVSPAESWDYSEEIDDDAFDRHRVTFVQDERPNLEETLYYMHGDLPGHAVSLPDGWTEDWT